MARQATPPDGQLALARWQWIVAWLPRLSEGLALPALMGWVFVKSMAVMLAITFGLHIVLRGFWAAALGLHSVYPDGIQWDKVKSGPIYRAAAKATVAPLPVFVARLDNTSSLVFALGAVLLMLTALSSVGALAATGGTYLLSRVTGGTLQPVLGALVAFGVLVAPILAGSLVDRLVGARLAPSSPLRRVLERLASASAAVSATRLVGPMMLVFTSRQGQLKGTVVLIGMIYSVFGLVFAQAIVLLDLTDWSPYRYLAASGPEVAQPVHYADQRVGDARYSSAPFIPSDIVQDRVLKVFVPYRIPRFDAALANQCPDAAQAAVAEDTAAARAASRDVVSCFARLLAPTLDGQPVVGGTWWIGTDPVSEQRGFVLLLPLRTTSEGEHLLVIRNLPRRRDANEPEPSRIPFVYAPR